MRVLMIIKRVFKEFFRDKRTLALMFVAPIFIMWLISIVFSASTTTDVSVASVNTPTNVAEIMKNVDNVSLEQYQTKEEADKKLKDGEVDTVIYYDNGTYNVTYANIDSSKTVKAQQVLKSSIQGAEVKNIVEVVKKINPKIENKQQQPELKEYYNYGNADTTFFNKIAPVLIGYILFFYCFLISGMALLKERTTGTLDRLLATPVKRSEVVFGYILAYSTLAIVQTIIVTLSSIYLLNIEVVGSLYYVIIVNVLLAMVALTLGLLLSTIAKSEFQIMQFIPIVVIPQMFFSGIVSVESMGKIAVYISKILPVTYASDGLSKIILEGKSLVAVKHDVIVLIVFCIVLIVLNIIGLKRYRKVFKFIFGYNERRKNATW